MRENNRVTIIFKGADKRYDARLGKMVEGQAKQLVLPCHLSDMGIELKNQLLGKANVDAKVLRFNRPIGGAIERVLIDDRPFVIVNRKGFYNRQAVLYVSEVLQRG